MLTCCGSVFAVLVSLVPILYGSTQDQPLTGLKYSALAICFPVFGFVSTLLLGFAFAPGDEGTLSAMALGSVITAIGGPLGALVCMGLSIEAINQAARIARSKAANAAGAAPSASAPE